MALHSYVNILHANRYSIFEIAVYVAQNFAYIDEFPALCPHGDSTIKNVLAAMVEPRQRRALIVELAVMVDVGLPLARACYRTEGDGPVTLFTYETFITAKNHLEAPPFTNVFRVLEYEFSDHRSRLTPMGQAEWDGLFLHAQSCVEPAYAYITKCETKDLKHPLEVLKASCVFNPYHIAGGTFRQAGVLDMLRQLCAHVPALDRMRDDVLMEVPDYMHLARITLSEYTPGPASEDPAALADADHETMADVDILEWWRGQPQTRLPCLFAALKITLLLHPNSGGPERVFSLINTYVSRQQQSMYDQTLKTQTMLQYNHRAPATQNTRSSKSYVVTWNFIREYYGKVVARVNAAQ